MGSAKKITTETKVEKDEHRDKIYALAKKQRMNTDAKRNVFYNLMTAEDYIDAFEKIVASSSDERTIIGVILHCCLSEKSFNSFYAVLAQKFCDHSRKFLLAIQFAVWDKIKDIQSLTSHQSTNLSRLLAHLIVNSSLPLSVLKVVEFGQIEKSTIKFMRKIMLILLASDEEKLHKIFGKIAPKLNAFKDQLRLFLKVFLFEKDKNKMSAEQMTLIKARLQIAEKYLSN
jgi:nucleolar MIF4G domain-containing protein 1